MNETDIQTILEHRYDQGWDYWTTEDRRLGKGAPFSCLEFIRVGNESARRNSAKSSRASMGELA